MMAYRRRRRFGTSAGAVLQSTMAARRRSKCRACHLPFEKGDTVVRLRLRKSFRQPCVTCGHKLLGVRWYHTQCVPIDLEKAMGYDPQGTRTQAPPPAAAPVTAHSHQAAPPAKPLSVREALIAWMLAGEAALKRKLAENPALMKNKDLDAVVKTYNGCKARFLRPGTDAEGELSMKMALKKLVDVVMFT
jgi:hypothetical protein